MTLYFIGLGLNDEKDITVKGFNAVKKCKYIYLESYTSLLQITKEDLEKFYNKEVTTAEVFFHNVANKIYNISQPAIIIINK